MLRTLYFSRRGPRIELNHCFTKALAEKQLLCQTIDFWATVLFDKRKTENAEAGTLAANYTSKTLY